MAGPRPVPDLDSTRDHVHRVHRGHLGTPRRDNHEGDHGRLLLTALRGVVSRLTRQATAGPARTTNEHTAALRAVTETRAHEHQ